MSVFHHGTVPAVWHRVLLPTAALFLLLLLIGAFVLTPVAH
jgi:hypothetical protein